MISFLIENAIGLGNRPCATDYKDYGDKLCKPIDPCAKDQTCVNQVRSCSNNNGDAVCGSCLAGATEINGWCYTVDIPVITNIDGDGTAAAVVGDTSAVQNPQLATHRFQTSWVITGNYLNNITDVELDQGGSKVFSSADGLIFQRGDTNMTGKILLPALLTVGAFTLVINRFGGQASAQVYVLQGESVTSAPEPAGTNCKYGGMKITSASGASYVCSAEQQQTYFYVGSFATPNKWEADLLLNSDYSQFCTAIGKQYVSAQTFRHTFNTDIGNGWFASGEYYFGPRRCDGDTWYAGPNDPNSVTTVWVYVGTGTCNDNGPGNITVEDHTLITCQ